MRGKKNISVTYLLIGFDVRSRDEETRSAFALREYFFHCSRGENKSPDSFINYCVTSLSDENVRVENESGNEGVCNIYER